MNVRLSLDEIATILYAFQCIKEWENLLPEEEKLYKKLNRKYEKERQTTNSRKSKAQNK